MKIIIMFGLPLIFTAIALGVFLLAPRELGIKTQIIITLVVSFIAMCVVGVIIGMATLAAI